MSKDVPIGQRFSMVYMDRGTPMPDSPRMRNRVRFLVRELKIDGLARYIEAELGVYVPGSRDYDPNWDSFFNKSEIRDILDTVTGIVKCYGDAAIPKLRRIFEEENTCYVIDDRGGVHYSIDREFVVHRAAAISTLAAARYDKVREQFEAGYAALDTPPPDGKAAIRANFAAVEGLFRMMFPSAINLSKSFVKQHLDPFLQRLNAGDATAFHATQKASLSFLEWIEAVHFYRHESATGAQPPLQLAILLVSNGANWLRWLAEIDRERSASAPK